jgi:hypothetical protein
LLRPVPPVGAATSKFRVAWEEPPEESFTHTWTTKLPDEAYAWLGAGWKARAPSPRTQAYWYGAVPPVTLTAKPTGRPSDTPEIGGRVAVGNGFTISLKEVDPQDPATSVAVKFTGNSPVDVYAWEALAVVAIDPSPNVQRTDAIAEAPATATPRNSAGNPTSTADADPPTVTLGPFRTVIGTESVAFTPRRSVTLTVRVSAPARAYEWLK